jgi:hypothetical protein
VTPEDDEAARLCLDEAFWPQPRQSTPAVVTATVTPISSRAAGSHPADRLGDSDRLASGRAMLHPSRSASAPASAAVAGATASAAGSTASRQHAVHVQAHADEASAEIEPAGPGDRAAQPGESRRAQAGPGRERGTVIAEGPASTAAAVPESPAQEPDPEAAPPARPARRASGGRPRRSSVPSWDEIMFGNSRQPE